MGSNHHIRNLPVPFFSQREVKYRWQRIARNIRDGGEEPEANPAQGIEARFYNEDEAIGYPVSLAHKSCNIVSLCMLLHYYGITDDSPDRMLEAFFSRRTFPNPSSPNAMLTHDFSREENIGYPYFLGPNRLQVWSNFRLFAESHYGIPNAYFKHGQNLNIAWAKGQIAKGHPVMISYGITSGPDVTNGHIAVIRGFTEDDHVIINDPWGDVATPDGFLKWELAQRKNNKKSCITYR